MRRRQDSGYALLLVLLISALIAISLYKQLPRVAFDNERQKEQLLIERGEQYKRAIQLFLRANKNTRWPASIDELESFNNQRFLRHRYKDPMTGKDEWRLIHIANGVLTDSVNNKQKKTDEKEKGDGSSSNITAYAGLGEQTAPGTAAANPANRRRASEGGAQPQLGPDGQPLPGATPNPNLPPGVVTGTMPGMPPNMQGMNPGQLVQGFPQPGGMQANGQPFGQPGQPNFGQPGQPNFGQPGQPNFGQPGFNPGAQQNTNQPNQPTYGGSTVGNYGSIGSTPTPAPPNFQGQNPQGLPGAMPGGMPSGFPGGYPGVPGPPANSQNLGGTPAYPNTAGSNGVPPNYPQPGMSINPQQSSAAAALIGSLLTSPRPGGMPTPGAPGGNTIMGGGIAGVASNAEGEGIMVYGDHTNFNEWEFIWDPTKWRPPPNPLQGTIGTSAASLGSTPTAPVGTPAAQMNGPGGTNPLPQTPPSAAGFGAGGAPPSIRPGRQ